MRFDKFTIKSQELIQNAQALAAQHHNQQIEKSFRRSMRQLPGFPVLAVLEQERSIFRPEVKPFWKQHLRKQPR
jgi:hypothetical protein